MSEENKIFVKKENIKKSIIPNYQRGYKWEISNVEDLLNDINNINNIDKNEHCLHNLTIIENKNKWEIIDGQQRLTTIFLILKYLGKEYYSLSYKIRQNTEDFFNNEINDIIKNLKDNKYKKELELFNDMKNKNNNYDKQDIYYICRALFTIYNWFNKNYKDKPIEAFIEKLESVYFYKHEIKTNIKGETIFSNLNSGRVPLTDIELIKADLIINISDSKIEYKENKSEILINEIRSNIGRLWDEMESWLAQDEVWYWIAPKNNSVNKLSLLFGLCSELKEGKNIYEKYYNYVYDKNLKCDYSKIKTIWENIKNYYYTIKDWYLDNDLYHLIGIIVSFGINIKEFIENNYNIKNKNELKSELKNEIIIHLKLTNKDNKLKFGDIDYLELDYNNDKDEVNKIFTLLNCLEGYNYDKNKFNEHFRYRFDIHNKYKWSIEHIIPRNPKKDTILDYFNDIIKILYNEQNEELEKIKGEIKEKLNEPKYKDFDGSIEKLKLSNNDKLKEEFIEYFNNIININNIGNLALLGIDTNSSLKNKIFKEKRNILLKFISNEGKFIPPLTLKVFSKTFDSANGEEMYWTHEDFNKYEEYQEKKLKYFINSIEKRGNKNE
ncbi:DUF262 domain-containing protein [Brachyspira aalborgi]|uniref:DUF262 domain-containing protein n=1 Tax=Brachyspira aalborgi TaxID=29522 RepID=A0A5C8GJH0_9SPIR|nr:DUF262 domain-containing protein [Brachyspira aalborgi]TXJ61969.1 DUF262 domain-containing protein [Brachyspira aalborgi]